MWEKSSERILFRIGDVVGKEGRAGVLFCMGTLPKGDDGKVGEKATLHCHCWREAPRISERLEEEDSSQAIN